MFNLAFVVQGGLFLNFNSEKYLIYFSIVKDIKIVLCFVLGLIR